MSNFLENFYCKFSLDCRNLDKIIINKLNFKLKINCNFSFKINAIMIKFIYSNSGNSNLFNSYSLF